jgi:hypothetical protein
MEVTHLQMIITPSITLGTKQDITDLDRRRSSSKPGVDWYSI